ncbi:uncharacterized protein LOC110944589 [Helianthus annuus]|uniref:uncharacterized protein LOC110944589 n=1 Tax=Helianthus annuus TaxID=4232 RepID=UPI000B8FD25F|nr:uncharacterized protein LOC110944589 [Helianthus annuus]
MTCKPSIYNGEVDLIACQRWLSDIKGVFEWTHGDPSDFVAYGTGQLRGQAKDWLDNLRNEKRVEATWAITWEDFKTLFLKHQSPKAEREIELKKQIERGERRAFVANLSPTNKQNVAEPSKKENVKGGSSSYKTCDRAHRGECYFKNKPRVVCGKMGHAASNCPGKVSVCYKCYQPGHKKSECPELVGRKDTAYIKAEVPRSQARSFQVTAAEAKNEPHVVTGTFTVNLIPAHVLFDMGVNKSFVSHEFVQHQSFILTKLPMPLEVEVGEFQVVVGMDWLSRYHANVICFRKEIQVTSPSERHVIIYGEKSCNPIVCSMIEVRKLIQPGCRAYLTYVRGPEKESPKVEDVPAIREFEDVFPEDLPGIPPEREVEFRIELIPGAKPVAKAPYRLAPSELEELISQLQDLLDKGFI